jgi:hypothetical protein
MSLSTFAGLKGEIADFLNRQDLTTKIPTFITLAEADLNRRVRHYEMIKRKTTTLYANGYRLPQPDDWLQAANMQCDGVRLLLSTETEIDVIRNETDGVTPTHFCPVGNEIEFAPAPASNVTIEQIYYARIAALSDSATSNWLLLKFPDAYLYGSLIHSAPYLDEDPRVATWNAGYERALTGIAENNRRSMTSGGRLVRRFTKTFG